jgi:3-oxoadipate enol-lactonase
MSFAHVNGVEIFYQMDGNLDGSAPWLTLSHSLACDSSMWDPQIDLLSRSFKVLRFDTRGHGRSSAPPAPYTLDQMAQDVYELLKTLGITQTHWMGLSMGGMIAQTIALNYPRLVASMVLADSTSKRADNAAILWGERIKIARANGMQALVDSTLSRWFTESYRQGHPDSMARIGQGIASTPLEGYCGSCAAIAEIDYLDRLHEINIPALVIVGDQDHGTPQYMSELMAAHLPQADLVVLKDAAHISNIEQTDAFNQALVAFYNKQGMALAH